MTTFPRAPRLVKGAIVAINPKTNRVERTIAFQYNPETLSRSLQVQVAEGEGNARAEAFRIKGAPVETIRMDIEIDATDRLETAEPSAVSLGIYPQLAALETLLYPNVDDVVKNMSDASRGTMEIVPLEAPLTLLIWGQRRVLPVRISDFSVAEEAYDVNLNPIRAKITLSLRVLTYDDLPWQQRGSNLFLSHHRAKQQLARQGGIPASEATRITQVNISGL